MLSWKLFFQINPSLWWIFINLGMLLIMKNEFKKPIFLGTFIQREKVHVFTDVHSLARQTFQQTPSYEMSMFITTECA